MSARHCQIFVTKLPRDTTRDDIKDMFRTFGKIREITPKKGFAFVEFYDRHDADDAIDRMNGERVEGGNRLVCERAGEKKSRRESRGPQRDDKCFNCGDRGHWANECKKSSRSRRKRYSSSRSYSSDSRRKQLKHKRKSGGEKRRGRSSSDSWSKRSSSSSRSKSNGSSKSRSRSREIGEKVPRADQKKVEHKKSNASGPDVGVEKVDQGDQPRKDPRDASKASRSRSRSRTGSKATGSKSSHKSRSS
jgi:arginine/serine-rich splicing factor 7